MAGPPRRPAPGVALAASLVLAGWTAGSCGSPAPAPAPPSTAATAVAVAPCAPVQGTLAAGTRAAGMAGEYRLALVATSGPRAGSTAAGSLRLRSFGTTPPPVPAAPGGSPVRYPLYGATTVSLEEVGATAPGDVRRDDPARPGVLGIEWEQAGRPEITLRMGADANQGDQMRFDGATMALFVTSVTPGRVAGRWESGGTTRAGGHFCAERV